MFLFVKVTLIVKYRLRFCILVDLPDSFYSLTPAEIKALISTQQSKYQQLENAPLMTKAMRKREELLKQQRYPKTMIRVRFPDHTT